MTADQRARLENLRLQSVALCNQFARVTQGDKAGRVSLGDEAAMLAQIGDETSLVAHEMADLVTAMAHPAPPISN